MNRNVRLALSLAAFLALILVFGSVRAEDPEDKSLRCSKCAAIAKVVDALRCDKCDKDKLCEACEKRRKDIRAAQACEACKKDGACEDCSKTFAEARKAHNDCGFCAAKALVAAKVYCCKTEKKPCPRCAPGGPDKPACTKCAALRQPINELKCESCDKDAKK